MTKPDFANMPNKELRQYVLEHRDDDEAFYALVDQFHANPNKVTVGPDEDITQHIKRMVERQAERHDQP